MSMQETDGDVLVNRIRKLRLRLRTRSRRVEILHIQLTALEQLHLESQALKYKRFGARRGLVTLLSEGPRSINEILEVVPDRIKSQSSNRRRVVQTTLGQMINEGRITDRADGTFELVEA